MDLPFGTQTPELEALGAASMVARISGMMAPYLNFLATIWRPLPLLVCGSLSLTAGLLSLLLPETHND